MSQNKSVGLLDAAVRVVLGGLCVAVLVYNFAIERLMPIYAAIPVFILVPLFFKTGLTRSCPIMESLGVSTAGGSDRRSRS